MNKNSKPVAVLIGRPNVGKSTLFNKLIRSNRAITHDRPGITRDRLEGFIRFKDRGEITIVDTGGINLNSHSKLEQGPEGIRGFEEYILEQASEAALEADLLCLVVDAKDGLTPFDQHLAFFLRKYNKPIITIVNKVDGAEKADLLTAEFHNLGMSIIPCSAAHGFNIQFLEEYLLETLLPIEEVELELPNNINLDGATKKQKRQLLKFFGKPTYDNESEESSLEPGSKSQPSNNENSETLLLDNTSINKLDADNSAKDNCIELSDSERELAENNDLALLSITNLTDNLNFDNEQELDSKFEELESENPEELDESTDSTLKIAFLGRPNAGKSSLVNALIGKRRLIVSDIAGTTRDSIDVNTVIQGEEVTFVDTAGIRRRAKITDVVERFSVNSSLKSTTKANVTFMVLDGAEGLTLQDKRLIQLLHERKTPFAILINKTDLMQPDLRKKAEKQYKEALNFCYHVPVIFVSAISKNNIRKIIPTAKQILNECKARIGTGALNRSMEKILFAHQPPMVQGARPKFFYMTQAETNPPTFVFFVSNADKILPPYQRYIEKSLRQLFGIKHAPMRINFRTAHKKKNSQKRR